MYSHLIKKNISLPKTVFLSKTHLTVEEVTHLFDELGSPLIVKEPSTSFSLRVEKVSDIAGFFRVARRFIKLSDWIVVQQYIESRYDWRVGVLGGNLLYACKYTIPSDTFKIQASVNGHLVYCGVESVSPDKVPPHVIDLGIDAANAIGKGLYGVDIKNNNGDAYVIEVNDNPSIESGEDDCYPRVFEQIVSYLFTT
jgi:glutathione synthase/RimK-type ligase-like ATP-grasp enzyme